MLESCDARQYRLAAVLFSLLFPAEASFRVHKSRKKLSCTATPPLVSQTAFRASRNFSDVKLHREANTALMAVLAQMLWWAR